MKSMCTKKFALTVLIIGTIPVAFMFFTSMYEYKSLFLALFIFPIALLFSLITYFLPEAVFRAWARFTTWWVPLQILLVALIPESSGGYFVSILDKQLVAIILSILFVIISLGIVLVSWFKNRR